MEAVEKIKGMIIDLDINEMAELKHWLLSEGANVFDLSDLAEAAEERGWNCPLDHVDDLEDHEIREMAIKIGMVDAADNDRLSEMIAEGRTRDALDELASGRETLHPKTQLWLADIRGRAL